MNKIGIILLLIFCANIEIMAQDKYGQGYIIKTTGDTIFGLVQRRGYVNNEKKCLFKTTNSIAEYEPNEILGYGLTNESYYLSTTVEDSKKLFLQILAQGKATLLHRYTDKQEASFYVIIDDKVTLIPFNKTKKSEGIVYNTRYKGVFRVLMYDCDKSVKGIENINYEEKQFVKLVERYNDCFGGQQMNVENKNEPHVQIGIRAGIGNYSLRFSSNYNFLPYLYESKIPSVVAPLFGLALELPIMKIKNSSVSIQAIYNNVEFKSSTTIEALVWEDSYSMSFKYAQVSIPILFKYKLHGNKARPYLGIGVSGSFMLKYEDNVSKNTVIGTTTVNRSDEFILENPRKFEQSLIGEAGIEISVKNKPKILVGISYSRGNGLSKILSLSSKTRLLSANVYYLF